MISGRRNKARSSSTAARESIFPTADRTMRRAISLLDEEQRGALLELADFGVAVCSARLIIAVLQGLINLVT
jgi:hypothetical protein